MKNRNLPLGKYNQAADAKRDAGRTKEQARTERVARGISKYVLRKLGRGVTDMPIKAHRLGLHRSKDDEAFGIARDTLAQEGIGISTYSTYDVEDRRDYDRIAVTNILDQAVEPSARQKEVEARRAATSQWINRRTAATGLSIEPIRNGVESKSGRKNPARPIFNALLDKFTEAELRDLQIDQTQDNPSGCLQQNRNGYYIEQTIQLRSPEGSILTAHHSLAGSGLNTDPLYQHSQMRFGGTFSDGDYHEYCIGLDHRKENDVEEEVLEILYGSPTNDVGYRMKEMPKEQQRKLLRLIESTELIVM